MHLSIIIPAYNEEGRLPRTLEEINEYLSQQSYDSEIIVVSDGSTDKTVEIVKNLMSQIKNLRLIEFKERRGKGFGVKQGMLEAKGDFRIFTDADNSTSIDQVEKMWPEFSASAEGYGGSAVAPTCRSEGGEKGYDIVIGSRDIKGAVLDPPQPWIRKIILGESFKIFRKIVIGLWGIEDTQCGFKGFTKKAAEDIFPKSKISHFAFDPEILAIAQKFGYKIKEIPVYWRNDLQSKVKFKNIIKMAIDLIEIRWNIFTHKYDEKFKA